MNGQDRACYWEDLKIKIVTLTIDKACRWYNFHQKLMSLTRLGLLNVNENVESKILH